MSLMLVLGLLHQREQNTILATAVKWNGKLDLAVITHWNTSLMCGRWFSLCYLDPDSPQTALLDRIREGCISVTWLIPSYLVPQLTKRAKINTKFFQKHGILKVTVSDQCIYEEETSKENGPVSINSYLVGCHIVALCVSSCELSNAFILCAQLLLSYSMFQCLEYSLDQ